MRLNKVAFPGAEEWDEGRRWTGFRHCGSAEESVIISSISDKSSVINTDLVSGSLLSSPRTVCDTAGD